MENNIISVKSRFTQFEQELNLFNQTITNVRFWQYIRFSIFNQIIYKLGINEESHFTESKKSRYIKAVFRDLKNILTNKSAVFQKKKDKDIIVFNHPRKKLINGEYWEIYTDFLLDNSNFNYQIIEVPSFTHGWHPTKNKSTKYLDYWVFAVRYLFTKLNFITFSEKEKILTKNMEKHLEKNFGIKIDIKGEIKKNLCKRKAYIHIFERIISKLNPKLIIEVVGYTIQNLALNELCRRKNIPTIEFQHGTINSFHLGYHFPKNVKVEVFPTYFFSFGKFWIESVNLPIPQKNIIPVGFPYFESQFSKFPVSEKKTDTILFISQGSIGKELSELAVKFSQLTSKKIIFKLHPGEYLRWENNPYFEKNEKIQVIDNNLIPLYQLFQESFIVVGVYSTALYEALMFKNYIFIYNLPSYVNIKELVDKGYANLFSNAQELHEKVELVSNQHKSDNIDINYFFKENSVENQIQAIKNVLSKISNE